MNNLKVFNQIDDDIGKQIIINAKKVTLAANSIVFHQGDACVHYLLVLQGSVKVFTRNDNGREILLYRVTVGESCTLTTSCLLTKNKYPAEGITETEVTALLISKHDFDHGLNHSPSFRNFVFSSYAKRLTDVISLVQSVSFARLEQRLAKLLLSKSKKHTTIKITHHDLATELGSTREVISRQLKIFEKLELITLGRSLITIQNYQALEKIN